MTDHTQFINTKISENEVVFFSKSFCPYCNKAKFAANKLRLYYHCIELDNVEDGDKIQDALEAKTGQRTVPNIFIKGVHIGGCDDFLKKIESGEVKKLLEEE